MIRYFVAPWRKVRHIYNPRWRFYRDTIMSIADHDTEFNAIEDAETEVVRTTEKARAALADVPEKGGVK